MAYPGRIIIHGITVSCILLGICLVDAEWLEVFSTVKGTGQTVYDAWSAGPDDQVLHNKCPVVEHWGSLNIQQVKIVLESSSGNIELIFDGQSTDKFSWFSKSRLVSSPWNDIDTEPQNYFSVEGDASAKRSFYINRNYGGCGVDAGWLMVADEGPDGVCTWERTSEDNAPLIMFSKQDTNAIFASDGDGECVVDPTMRQDCGYPGILQEECQQRGCCFDTSTPNAFFCFYKKAGTDIGTAERMVIYIDAGNGVLCSCTAGLSLSEDGTSCDVIADCSTSADSSQFSSEDTFTVSCPAGCSGSSQNKVWGTYIYTDDSSICRAAIHDGKLTNSGGQVTVYKWPGQDSYLDTDQNGVKSKNYDSWGGSFAFSPVTQKWRDDLRCGDGYTTGDGSAAECDPAGTFPCCSPGHWCGNTADHCDCADCVDYSDIASSPDYSSLGCWTDTADRAIPTLEGTDPRLDGDYIARVNPIEKCYMVARSRGFSVFAVQNGGWCAGSADGHDTYDKYGSSSACVADGEGGPYGNNVYQITDPLADPSETCQDGDGTSYRGIVAVTTSGRTCQAWDSQTPHEHSRTAANYPSSGLDGNFCRNPDGESGVWCYTTDPNERWELCDVEVCESTSSLQSASLPDFYLEIALFLDPSLIQELGGTNGAREWSKVVMVGVQRKFDSGSLGKILNLRVVKYGQADTLSMQSDSYAMLNSFCLWQESQSNSAAWDVAVLVVNRDLTSVNFGKGVLGRAVLGGVCSGEDSDKCAIVEYRGYQTIDTIVHELGHNVGMDHDGDGNDCLDGKDIMSTLDYGGKTAFSSCSAHSFNNFLKKTMTNCLNDEAENGVVYTIPVDTQPGELVSWDEQCEKALGTGWHGSDKGWRSRVGTESDRLREHEDRCSRILCTDGSGSEKNIVPVEGSVCGTDMWCRGGECIGDDLESAEPPQDGGWSSWNVWSGCTKTCGLFGVKWRYRSCDNPEPTFGGAYCVGDSTEFGICELQSCEDAIGFYDERLDQCAAHNANETFVPYLSVPPRLYCKLTCMSEQNNDWVVLGNVEDGAYCHEYDNDICIDGVCRSVGCDGVFDSNTTYDKCGVCGGDGSSCVMKSGRKTFESTIGFHDIVTVPEGAKFVRVKELYPGKHDEPYWTSYLSVATQNDTCIISCSMESSELESGYAEAVGTTFRYWQKLVVDTPLTYDTEYHGAGSIFTYGRFLSITEEVFTYGPIMEPVNFRYISVSDLNVTYEVSYEYSLPTYTFHQTLGPCSKTCGYGMREVLNVSCYHNGLDEIVGDSFCEDFGQERPSSDPISCFNMLVETCKASWQVSNWSDCSRTCAGGIQNRNVTCMRASDDASGIVEQVPLYECIESDYPSATKLCNTGYCDPYWDAGAWGSCSTTCGPGKRHRSIRCMAIGIHHVPIHVDPSLCDADLKPSHEVDCWEAGMEPVCPLYYWRMELSACSVSCGQGVQSAQLKCAASDTHDSVDMSYCQAYTQPDEPSVRECHPGDCSSADTNSNTNVEYHLSNATMVMCSHFDEVTRHALCDGQARFLHLLQTADQVYHFTACPNSISLFLLIDPNMVPSDHAEMLLETSDIYKFYKAKADVVLNEVFHCGHEMDIGDAAVTEIGEVNSAGPQDVELTGDYYRFDYHNTMV
ncbi:A disintegrin and metalloproteinase with thrombospondin motifs 20-like [Branchiostoma floridae x Branchiostoma japonicum]